MPNLLRRAAVAFSTAAVCAVALSAPAAHAAATSPAPKEQWSYNWAGYYAEASAPITYATADFTVPKVSCDQSRGTPQSGNDGNEYQAVMWAGIGGINGVWGINSGWLKQAGVMVSCKNPHAAPTYQPFWEYVPPSGITDSPFNPQYFKTKNGKTAELQPGDSVLVQVSAPSVSPVAGKWYFRVDVYDPGSHSTSTFATSQYLAASTDGRNQTAEVITEKNATGLVYLGSRPVAYTGAIYLTTKTGEGLSIASRPINLLNTAKPHGVIVYPSAPFASERGTTADSFNTYYATDWLP